MRGRRAWRNTGRNGCITTTVAQCAAWPHEEVEGGQAGADEAVAGIPLGTTEWSASRHARQSSVK
jgi:hypothetical protein